MTLLKGTTHDAWMQQVEAIRKNAGAIAAARDMLRRGRHFFPFPGPSVGVAENFGASGNIPVYRFHCPMADNNRGADWLQGESENPESLFRVLHALPAAN